MQNTPSNPPSGLTAVPIFGPIARAMSRDINIFHYILVILLTLLVLAVKAWGVVALSMTALALVPLMFVMMVVFAWG
ncbi:MAG: hypothetical protein WCC57_02330 [Paracoccaceae bacterium]